VDEDLRAAASEAQWQRDLFGVGNAHCGGRNAWRVTHSWATLGEPRGRDDPGKAGGGAKGHNSPVGAAIQSVKEPRFIF